MLIGVILDATAELAYWTATRTIAGVWGTASYAARWVFVASKPEIVRPAYRPSPETTAVRCIKAAALLHRRGALSDKELVAAVRSVVQTAPPAEDGQLLKIEDVAEPSVPSAPPAYDQVPDTPTVDHTSGAGTGGTQGWPRGPDRPQRSARRGWQKG